MKIKQTGLSKREQFKHILKKGNLMKNFTNKIIACLFLAFSVVLFSGTSNAQESKFRDQAWRYGLNLGLNWNSASLGYQYLRPGAAYPGKADFDVPSGSAIDHSDGTGMGLYGGLFIEYLSDSWWGVQVRASYDTKDALVKDTYISTKSVFDTKMSYLTFAPALRIDQHFIPNLSITLGMLIGVNVHGTFDYTDSANPTLTAANTGIKVTNRTVASLGITGGIAYDIELSRSGNNSMYISPFFDYDWLAAQRKKPDNTQNSSNDIWSTQTFRAGIRLSWEHRNPPTERVVIQERIIYVPYPMKPIEAPPGKKMVVIMPINNTIVTKNINGYFPILPYVFFDKGSCEIPTRYVVVSKNDAASFNESQLGDYSKGDYTAKETNINQLMVTYYNVLNIFGDRMRKNPDENLTLSCSDPDKTDDLSCAINVKNYLVNNFGINPDRIKIVSESPRKPSGGAFTDPAFTGMINDENRRVGFVFSNPDMYKPVPYIVRDETAIDNDMIFSVGKDVPFKTWDITITGEGRSMYFGPFTSDYERINPAEIMRDLPSGTFNAKVVLTEDNGRKSEENTEFKLYKSRDSKNASRYLMIFDYNRSDPIMVYETKIRKEITPGMAVGNTVIVHGHTDIIGNEKGNLKLSQERSDQAKRIIDSELGKEDRIIDVQSIGIGQTKVQYTFDNKNPEGRMYNRNVFVEVIK